MQDAALVGVADGLADVEEQRQAAVDVEPGGVAVGGHPLALDQLHDEVGRSVSMPRLTSFSATSRRSTPVCWAR